MSQKNYAEVLIDGVIYTLGGSEDEAYLRRVAAYLNEKIGTIKKQRGFSRQSADYQNLMIQLNIADDYFKEQERADMLSGQKALLEKEAYSLKHELITMQMRMEAMEKEMQEEKLRAEEVVRTAAAAVQNTAVMKETEAAVSDGGEESKEGEPALQTESPAHPSKNGNHRHRR